MPRALNVRSVMSAFARLAGRRASAPPRAQPPGVRAPAAADQWSVASVIEHASGLVTDQVSGDASELVARYRMRFDAVAPAAAGPALFVYHADLPVGATAEFRDVRLEVVHRDYFAVLSHFIERKRRFAPDRIVYLATSEGSRYADLEADDVRIVGLPVDVSAPMYCRAAAMYAFTLSRACSGDTAFLDSDAFLNAPLEEIFALAFDVALTFREEPGFMPVNEAVIFARGANHEPLRRFFQRVFATYDRLAADPVVRSYGDIRVWRGGQLALNAVTRAMCPYSPYRRYTLEGVSLRFLPCDTFNYSFRQLDGAEGGRFAGKYIVHLKGERKSALQVLRDALAAADPDASGEDRKYSLDTTPPVDYEPPVAIDYEGATLTRIADHFKTDKGSIKHRYTDVYARHFDPLRGGAVRVLEIGVACGASLKMWSKYFGPRAQVVGVDVRPECAGLCSGYPNVRIVIADATAWDPAEEFDIAIDDGSHVSLDISRTFERLWPHLRPGGYYAVEDLRCTYDPAYRSMFPFARDPADFDRAHFVRWLDRLMRQLDQAGSDIDCVHCYPQLLIVRKR